MINAWNRASILQLTTAIFAPNDQPDAGGGQGASPPPGAMSGSTVWRPNVAWRAAIPALLAAHAETAALGR